MSTGLGSSEDSLTGYRLDEVLGIGPRFLEGRSFLRISASRLSGGTVLAAICSASRQICLGLVDLLELEEDVAQVLEDRRVGGAAPFFSSAFCSSTAFSSGSRASLSLPRLNRTQPRLSRYAGLSGSSWRALRIIDSAFSRFFPCSAYR